MASVKWLKRIELLTHPFIGEFETGHYMYQWADRTAERVTLMRPRARITDPHDGAIIPTVQSYVVSGKAWSRTGPVTNVDVSLPGESEWLPAHLETPKGPYQWQNWSFEWTPTEPGRKTLRARATDLAGNVRPEVPIWNRLKAARKAAPSPTRQGAAIDPGYGISTDS